MTRPYNFNPGPATIPDEVLQQAAAEMLDWHGCGMSVMEMSHRGKEFMSIYEQTQADLRELLEVPDDYHILFMQGGAQGENAIIPLNIAQDGVIDFVITGVWSKKSHLEASKYAQTHIAANAEGADGRFTTIPAPGTWQLSKNARYVHICSNETVHGLEFHELPNLPALGSDTPLVIDFSSHVASRPVDWSRVALAFGGAQKNLGPAGLTIVIVRKGFAGHACKACPSVFNFQRMADSQSMLNTPPTFAIYMAGLVFQWIKRQREGDLQGIAALESRNIAKARLLYDSIDQSQLYQNHVAPPSRSRMNVPFFLCDERLNEVFLEGAKSNGLLGLKGHKMVGGMRASIYNAMPMAGVQKLVHYMQDFEQHQA